MDQSDAQDNSKGSAVPSKGGKRTDPGLKSPVETDMISGVRPYDESIEMPSDFSISLKGYGGIDRHLESDTRRDRRHSMQGFDSRYSDIVDYIVRITHRIWEEKQVGYIYDTYRHNCRVTDDSGLQYGRDRIVANTVQTIGAFPDMRLYADEIIWAGDDVAGFRTSHRAVIVGHNSGFSRYGAPTGERIAVWCIANCRALENEIYDEFVIYNDSAMLSQLGFNLPVLAREIGNNSASQISSLVNSRFGEIERVPGQGKPAGPDTVDSANDGDVETMLRQGIHAIWNWRNLGVVDSIYAVTMRYYGPTNREYYGRGEYKAFLISFLAMFPDLGVQVDEVYYMGNESEGYLSSTRWSAVGTHTGNGVYGKPTGRRIHVWGITQHRIVNGLIQEEWMMFNEFQLMQQIYRDNPAPGTDESGPHGA